MGLVFAPAFGSCSSICRDSIVVSTLRCGRNNPGSNPGHGTFFFRNRHSVRMPLIMEKCDICCHFFTEFSFNMSSEKVPKKTTLPGFEPGIF